MMGLYSVILAFSTFVASLLGTRILLRLLQELDFQPAHAQLAVILSAIGFLTVVSLPAGILLAALVLVLQGLLAIRINLSKGILQLLTLAAILLALVGIHQSPGSWPAPLADWMILPLAGLLLFALLAGVGRSSLSFNQASLIAISALVPISLAPLFFSAAHSSLALDTAIINAALIGGLIVLPQQSASSHFKLPLVALVGYAAIQTAHYGAWPLALVSLAILLAGMFSLRSQAEASQ